MTKHRNNTARALAQTYVGEDRRIELLTLRLFRIGQSLECTQNLLPSKGNHKTSKAALEVLDLLVQYCMYIDPLDRPECRAVRHPPKPAVQLHTL